MDDKQVQFIPFHAINEFMLSDYRLKVLLSVFNDFSKLPGERRTAINNHIKRRVKVPGFRNSTQAPAGIKARSSVSTFENDPEYVAQILQGWADLRPELSQKVFDFLSSQEWDLLPLEADRTKLPGFQIEWPKGQDYDTLGKAYAEMYPDDKVDENDLRLMIVWIANRLPYDMYDDEEEEEEEESA
ncbi:MAG: hypothetical protein GX491_21070 [Chloroflexi bacterium]|nr:hypothetical protein [Chloroflexota bacterium]